MMFTIVFLSVGKKKKKRRKENLEYRLEALNSFSDPV